MTTATEREHERVVSTARRRMAMVLAAQLAVVVSATVLVVTVGLLLGRATRWKSELLTSGRRTTGQVVDVHHRTSSKDSDRVSVVFDDDGREHRTTIEVGELSRYALGQPTEILHDAAHPRHVRTRWDSRTDPAETPAGLVLLAVALVDVLELTRLPRSIVGVVLGRGPWAPVTADVDYRPPAPRQNARVVVRFPDDDTPYGATTGGLARFVSTRYVVRCAGTGRWRVITTGRPVAVVRRARLNRTARRWRRLFPPDERSGWS